MFFGFPLFGAFLLLLCCFVIWCFIWGASQLLWDLCREVLIFCSAKAWQTTPFPKQHRFSLAIQCTLAELETEVFEVGAREGIRLCRSLNEVLPIWNYHLHYRDGQAEVQIWKIYA